jgi:hypothetical protein
MRMVRAWSAVERVIAWGLLLLTNDVRYLRENLQKDILPSIRLTYNPFGMRIISML